MTGIMNQNEWENFSLISNVRWTRDVTTPDEIRAGVRRWVSRDGDVVTVLSEVK